MLCCKNIKLFEYNQSHLKNRIPVTDQVILKTVNTIDKDLAFGVTFFF